jgi:uroporphyrin-3 C-methyltransferase
MTEHEPAAIESAPTEAHLPESAASPAPRPGQGAAWAVALLALATAAGGVYFSWQQRELTRAQDELRRTQSAQETGGAALRADLAKQSERLGGLDAGQREQARLLSETDQGMREARNGLEKLYAEMKGGRDLLPAEEASFLVRHAQYALHLARDQATALRALELAEARLREHGDPKWLPARESLAKAISQLRTQAPADITGITARLRALAARIENLPLASSRGETPPARSTNDSAAGWREFLRSLWEDLKGLVRVRHVENKFPLIAPEQRYFLAQNLALMLNGAQFAALRGDGATYRQNLAAARDWLKMYFDATQPPVVEAQGELATLIETPIATEPPDLAPLLSVLRKSAGR